jgi:hypothetical protein
MSGSDVLLGAAAASLAFAMGSLFPGMDLEGITYTGLIMAALCILAAILVERAEWKEKHGPDEELRNLFTKARNAVKGSKERRSASDDR